MTSVLSYIIEVLEKKETNAFNNMQAYLNDINGDDIFDIDRMDKYFDSFMKWIHITRVLNNLVSFQA